MRLKITFLCLLIYEMSGAQTIGGNNIFNFLKLPNTPRLTALGGINISETSNDVGLAFNNPALLKSGMHSQMNVVFNSFYADIKAYHLSLGYHHPNLNTNFLWGIQYFSYGNIQQTDAAGNIFGMLHPTDWVMQASASRSYFEKWNYGASLKFISSNYGQYKSNGVAMDVGILYDDSVHFFSASLVAKNMGLQLNKYSGSSAEDLPFDLQVGVSKKLVKAPIGFSITVYRLHQFDIRYNDTAFNNEIDPASADKKKNFTIDKIFRHFVFATKLSAGKYIEVTAAYNYLRRRELNIGKSINGLNGFSLGVGVMFSKLQIHYARSYYQANRTYNQFGMNLKLNEYFGLGKFGEKIGW